MREKIKKIPESISSMGRPQKNYLWLLVFIVFFWGLTAFLVVNFEPAGILYWLVGGNLFMALFFSLSLLLMSARSGFLWSLGGILFLCLRLWGVGGVFNLFLILGVILSLEFYFRKIKHEDLKK